MIGKPEFNIYAPDNARKLVRRVVAGESPEGELVEAIFEIAAAGRVDWDVESWQAVLDDLDSCNLKVGAWAEARGA